LAKKGRRLSVREPTDLVLLLALQVQGRGDAPPHGALLLSQASRKSKQNGPILWGLNPAVALLWIRAADCCRPTLGKIPRPRAEAHEF